MSGTSHDGLDIAYCIFRLKAGRWHYNIRHAVTIPYPASWKERLLSLPGKDEASIHDADLLLGEFIGEKTAAFIREYQLLPSFVSSHGHTIFHEPQKGITLQIGDGRRIADITGLTTICDFRSSDVAMGGQGAPLVPIGDRLLFADHDFCLNIGGIANISFEKGSDRIAFDICPANMVLNFMAGKLGKTYDDRGLNAATGKLIFPLLKQLESLPFYSQTGPRSLGREWVEQNIFPLLENYSDHPAKDILNTFTEHIARRISAVCGNDRNKTILVTGGGAYNDYLISRLTALSSPAVILPDPLIIEFKEALVFALLGLLRLREEVNVLGSVTGSGKDHCAGTVYG